MADTGLWIPRGTAAALERRLTPEPDRPLPADPVEWAQASGVHLWSKQREIIRSVVQNKRTLVPSCHEAGKTFLAALVGAYWLASAPPGERWLVSSAPSDRQVRVLLWQELARAKSRHGVPGTITGTDWWMGPTGARVQVGIGMKPQDITDPVQAMQRFQGFHRPEGVLVILDEATGIPPWLWTAVDTITGGAKDRLLAIGNPDDPSSEFAKRCDASGGTIRQPGQRYRTRLGSDVIPIDAYETPNMTGEPIPQHLADQLAGRDAVELWEALWPKGKHPYYWSKIRGVFPDQSAHNVISPAQVRAAWARELTGLERGCFGLDVARSVHGDESALYRERGGQIRLVKTWREPDSTTLAINVLRETAHVAGVPIAVDTDGVGGPIRDMIARGFPDLGLAGRRTISFSVAGQPHDPRTFDTRRTEVWWSARVALERGQWDLDEEDDVLAGQLMAPQWAQKVGLIHVETKKELAARGIESPDRADAAIMAYFGARMAGQRDLGAVKPRANGRRREPLVEDLLTRAL